MVSGTGGGFAANCVTPRFSAEFAIIFSSAGIVFSLFAMDERRRAEAPLRFCGARQARNFAVIPFRWDVADGSKLGLGPRQKEGKSGKARTGAAMALNPAKSMPVEKAGR